MNTTIWITIIICVTVAYVIGKLFDVVADMNRVDVMKEVIDKYGIEAIAVPEDIEE